MKQIDLNYFRKDLKIDIKKGGSSMYVRELVDPKYNITFDFDVYLPSKKKNLQRDFVWTISQKQELILSILKGIKIASVAIIIYQDDSQGRTDKRIYKIIDGKQRISTILHFYQNKFSLEIDDQAYFYRDLADDAQREIRLFTFTQDTAYEYEDGALISDDNKIKWFELINFSGTPQDKEHLNNLKS